MISSQTEVLFKHKAHALAERWKYATHECRNAQSFWCEFFTDLCEAKNLRGDGIAIEVNF